LKSIDNENKKAYQLYLEAPDVIKEDVKKDYFDTLTRNKKEIDSISNRIENLKSQIEDANIRIERYSETDYSEAYINEIESNPKKKREVVVSNIKEIRPYKVAYRVVVLEVITISSIYNVLLDANQRNNKEAYYIDRIYSMWQNSIDRYKAYDEGEYFVISNPDMVMDSENLEEFLTYNEVVEICKQNDWIIKY